MTSLARIHHHFVHKAIVSACQKGHPGEAANAQKFLHQPACTLTPGNTFSDMRVIGPLLLAIRGTTGTEPPSVSRSLIYP
jgi:hypothetical protein